MIKIETITCNNCGDIFLNITPYVQRCSCGNITCDSNGIYIRTIFERNNIKDASYKEIVLNKTAYLKASEADKKILLSTATVLKEGFEEPIEMPDNFYENYKLGKT